METNTRIVVIGAGFILAMSVLALSLYEPQDRAGPPATAQASAQTQTAPVAVPEPTVEETVISLVPRLSDEEALSRHHAVSRIAEVLGGGKASELTPDTREAVAHALISAYGESKDETPEEAQYRSRVVAVTIGRVGGAAARGFAAELLASGTDTVRVETVRAMLGPGASPGREAWNRALELARAGSLPEDLRPAVLRRALGRKSEEEILKLFLGEMGPAGIKACAVELQNLGKPELMGVILARLDEKELLKDSVRMPWFSGRLLAEHIRAATNDQLPRALKVAKSRPSLTRSTAKALKERIGDKDPAVRGMVARLIPDAVGNKGLDPESGEEMLVARLEEESDPSVKGAIEDSLAQVRLARQPQTQDQGETQAQTEPAGTSER